MKYVYKSRVDGRLVILTRREIYNIASPWTNLGPEQTNPSKEQINGYLWAVYKDVPVLILNQQLYDLIKVEA